METQLLYSIFGSIFMLTSLFSIYFYFNSIVSKNENNDLIVQRNNFETISKKANDMIFTINIINGKIYNVNVQASEILGYTITDLCKKTIHDLYPPEYLELSAQTIAEVWDKKGLVYQNLPFITSTGILMPVECSAKVLIYNDKPVIIIYARDIRERLKMEQEINLKNQLIVDKNKNITDSINYAKRIQEAVFGNPEQLNSMFQNAFVFFKPHSIVSGDFYWFFQKKDLKIIIAADCTGHGVPGAFMTLFAYNFLEEIIENQQIVMPDQILFELDQKISSRLKKDSSEKQLNDGMDMAILTFDYKNQKVFYAGAKNPLCIVQNNELKVIKASRFAIGGQFDSKKYELNEIDLVENTTFYIYTDGFQDQFGGKDQRKFLSNHFRELLFEISPLNLTEQKNILEKKHEDWKGNNHQTDDMLIIGIKI